MAEKRVSYLTTFLFGPSFYASISVDTADVGDHRDGLVVGDAPLFL